MQDRKQDWEMSVEEYVAKYGQEWYAVMGKPSGPPQPVPAWKVWTFGLGLLAFMAVLLTFAWWRDATRVPKDGKGRDPAGHVGR